jgi:chemotaxis protein CheX
MLTEVAVEMLAEIVRSVFITMMGLEVSVCDTPSIASAGRLTSFVQLTGDWNGTVIFECTKRQACQFSGRMLAMDPPEAVDDDVRDMLGELANMIAGNLKSGMAPGVRLSMPTVMDGSDYDLRVCGSQVQDKLTFECAEGHFVVTVLSNQGESFHPLKHCPSFQPGAAE